MLSSLLLLAWRPVAPCNSAPDLEPPDGCALNPESVSCQLGGLRSWPLFPSRVEATWEPARALGPQLEALSSVSLHRVVTLVSTPPQLLPEHSQDLSAVLGACRGWERSWSPRRPRSRSCRCPWFPLASVPDRPSGSEGAPSRVTMRRGAGGHHVRPTMTRALERHLPGPRRGLPEQAARGAPSRSPR